MSLPPSNAELAECLEDLARSDHFPRGLSGKLSAYNTEDVLAFSAASLRAQISASFTQGMAECERGEVTPLFDKHDRLNARRYEFLRSERLREMLRLFPTCETCDVGLDYAIDVQMRAESDDAMRFTDEQCAEMNVFGDALDGTAEIARLRAILAEIRAANTREYDGGVDNSLIEEIVAKGLT